MPRMAQRKTGRARCDIAMLVDAENGERNTRGRFVLDRASMEEHVYNALRPRYKNITVVPFGPDVAATLAELKKLKPKVKDDELHPTLKNIGLYLNTLASNPLLEEILSAQPNLPCKLHRLLAVAPDRAAQPAVQQADQMTLDLRWQEGAGGLLAAGQQRAPPGCFRDLQFYRHALSPDMFTRYLSTAAPRA